MAVNGSSLSAGSLRTALETSDAASLIGFYADDAQVKVIDKLHQPSNPLVLQGKDAIATYWTDVCGRAMAHIVEKVVHDGDSMVYSEACSYPDGTRVQCIAVLDLSGGKIVRQVGVQAWDE
jgi:predicted SnoaL-like aldol condensation-catalyzing enzyme